MKKIKKAWLTILIFALVLVTCACACANEPPEDPLELVNQLIEGGNEDVMLFDYFRQVVGTEEQQGYYEIVLYAMTDEEGKLSDEEVRMDVYTDGGLRSEKMVSYSVPYEAFTKAMEIADEYEMKTWEDEEDLGALDGCSYVCKFPYASKYHRVSSDWMPDNVVEAFNAILEMLQSYIPAS